jgi:SAM-dependent methyltransferase
VEDVSGLVARQYEAYAYPEPFTDLAAAIANGYIQFGDPALYAPLLWPRGRPKRPLRILVAGCGTVQAAYIAFRNRADEVVGVDLSEASLAHERVLQDRHNLSNLKLYRGDLRDVAAIGGSFDVILCTGVLHHMDDPPAGLAALRHVLASDGVMVLMLYGQAARTGVYMLQDVFRRIGTRQDAEGIAQVRAILDELPREHVARTYVAGAEELRHDAALVDTFLHTQDRAYTVPQLLELVEDAQLAFQCWIDNLYYWRDGLWGPDSAVARALDPLPERDHWAAVEMLSQGPGMHFFTATHARCAEQVRFDSDEWPRFVPHRTPGFTKVARGQFQRVAKRLSCTPAQELALDGIDERRTIAEILSHPAFQATPPELRDEFGRRLFEHLWKLGHVMIALPPR